MLLGMQYVMDLGVYTADIGNSQVISYGNNSIDFQIIGSCCWQKNKIACASYIQLGRLRVLYRAETVFLGI